MFFMKKECFCCISIETCPDPKKETNARVIGNEFYNGKEVEFTCSNDYVIIPEYSKKLKCENGKWKGEIPFCKGIIFHRKR